MVKAAGGGGARRREIERRFYDNPTKYSVLGREPDTADTLEADGLIKREFENGKHVATIVIEPDNLRVIAWQVGINEYCRAIGKPPIFHDLPARFNIGAPQGNA